ncbi:DNA-directed RNA polymerase I subunit RPA34.5-domain-containing protein [Aspergillus pseudonomiae]|uniref:DNA-directed RNA polymerase I subunit RPA34.5-domain-containing protein n=1 Tax=Aspergillus pseudonomiae TaxID=1506151 RepID=A0A5N7DBD3_9EURO|nr:DNA-directed RNA polymerase I subunit RPA34.5-domain-containing protein [Aspergillus pseudonomiae]KAB8261185.1 DNA-directed RNA polymerase I subunit RPA34.5-domain-containing protein [Aspergillus pseudonomiae]KAE8403692.1 DNA-directed RNA polymerase I subunit RPA34.5-domain-containing protein [Aspergillus pseudonomiae]
MAPKSKEVITSDSESSRSSSPEVSKEAEVSSSESETSDSDNDSVASETQDKKKSSKVSFQAPQPYRAPSGFKAAKKQSPPSSSTTSLLSDLRGKQVYHITAPAFLPLSKVKEISLGKVMKGEPVMKHEGVQYGIPAESITQSDVGGKALLLYDSKSQTYYTTSTKDIRSYHVQELINLPERSEENDTVLEAAKEQIKPPRKQPKHLKMRFRPVGSEQVPPETLGSSSEESEGEQPTFKVPKESRKEKEDKKRKHHQTDGEGSQPSAEPRKKSKKEDGVEKAEKSKKSSKSKEEKKRKKSDKSA